ncbi:hypothetical protein F0342_06870 [Bacillus sp. CH30_1T]|uniref:hypothetical protein n=1 Tax=Bacillus sp. CH30_1T TaxID=2604836 RepID=UPI0011EDD5CA|nr:hypothetical protein [Bacillus sp. CH30_1T]KAA0565325.1 hypothetical protein F0342_06870 [Bacillus sp. CH30_1T]
MFHEFVVEFNTENEMNEWEEQQKEKDSYFGYDGYWLMNGKEATEHFTPRKKEVCNDNSDMPEINFNGAKFIIGDEVFEIKPVCMTVNPTSI